MSATFVSFYVANRAMETSQIQINTVGNNISNVNTEGYTRQRVDIISVSSNSTSKIADNTVKAGLGSKATGISQLRDQFLDARYRAQNSECNTYSSIADSLTSLEDVFDEATTEALQGQLSDFLSDLESLSQSPTSADYLQVVASAAEEVTSIINMYANEIAQVKEEQVDNLNNTVDDDINVIIKNIAALNEAIREQEAYGNTPNELYDSRNLLVDELSGYANIEVEVTADQITDDLSIDNYEISIVDENGNKTYLVYNEFYNQLSVAENGTSGDYEIFVSNDIATDPDAPTEALTMINDTTDPLNDNITDGSLEGTLEVLNGKGSFADTSTGESDFKGIAYYEEAMDIFAQTFADVFNGLNVDSSGTATPLFTTDDGTSTTGITAANIQLSDAWEDDSSALVTTTEDDTEGAADNVLRMIAAMSDDQTFLESDGTTIFYTGSFHEYMNGLLGELSSDIELYDNYSDIADTVLTSISDSRESISGVSLNEEGTYLMAYQKCYNAAARFFTVIDENVDRIINNMGTAGL